MGLEQERPSRRHPPIRASGGAAKGGPPPRVAVSERDFGRLEEKTHQTEGRVDRLEDEVYGRKREGRAFIVSWWQVVIAGLFVFAASFGSALIDLFLPP